VCLPPLLVVAMHLLRLLVLGIVGVVLAGTVVVADVASTLDDGIVCVAFAFGNVVVDVLAHALLALQHLPPWHPPYPTSLARLLNLLALSGQ